MAATKAKAAAKPAARRRGGPGRPKKELNATEVRKLAELGCTHEEMAGFFGVSTDTIARRLKDDDEIRVAYEYGTADVRISLRRHQIAAAKNGNAAVLIWLGKQLLNQKDKIEAEVGELPTLVITRRPEG